MAEAWEFRKEDIDLESCRKRNIRIAGTWENHPQINVFNSCGNLALKMVKDVGFSIENKAILIVSGDSFGKVIYSKFKKERVGLVTLLDPYEVEGIDLDKFDLLFIADYISGRKLIDPKGVLNLKKDSSLQIVHLAGEVDIEFARSKNLTISPDIDGYHHRMTRTLAHLGNMPVIKLHAAGLKVGELTYKGKTSKLVQSIKI